MVRKVILGIFISVLSIFLMSYNVSAIDFSMNLENYNVKTVYNRPNLLLNYNSDTTTCQNIAYCTPLSSGSTAWVHVKSLQTYNSYNLKAGEIVKLVVFIGGMTPTKYLLQDWPLIQDSITTNNNNLIYLGSSIEDELSQIDINSSLGYGNVSGEYFTNILEKYNTVKIYNFYFKVNKDYNGRVGFESTNYSSNNANIWNYLSFPDEPTIAFHIIGMNVYEYLGSEENREVEEKTKEAVNDSQDSGNSSQSSVEGSTQSLMSAGASIMSALTSAPATDCNISLNTTGNSRVFTTAIGQLNLCSNVPGDILNMVQGIVALVFTPIVLYFTYNVITTLYNQFKEYNS